MMKFIQTSVQVKTLQRLQWLSDMLSSADSCYSTSARRSSEDCTEIAMAERYVVLRRQLLFDISVAFKWRLYRDCYGWATCCPPPTVVIWHQRSVQHFCLQSSYFSQRQQSLRLRRHGPVLASFIHFMARAVCCRWWQPIVICQALNRRAAGIGSWTSPIFHIYYTDGNLISAFDISYYLFTDDTQLYFVIQSPYSSGLAELSSCADAVTGWHIRNNLLLNAIRQKLSSRAQADKLPIQVSKSFIFARQSLWVRIWKLRNIQVQKVLTKYENKDQFTKVFLDEWKVCSGANKAMSTRTQWLSMNILGVNSKQMFNAMFTAFYHLT